MKIQASLSNLLLLTTVVALGVLLWLQRNENRWYDQRLPALKNAARELHVTDPSRFYAVKKHPQWYGEKIWKIHVPAKGLYKLCLATEEIPRSLGPSKNATFPKAEDFVELEEGIWIVELREKRDEVTEIEVLVGGQSVMSATKDDKWRYGNPTSSFTGDVQVCKSFDPGIPVRLIHLKNQKKQKAGSFPDETCNGVLLWIIGE